MIWSLPPPDKAHEARALAALTHVSGDDGAVVLDAAWEMLKAVAEGFGARVVHGRFDGDGRPLPFGWDGAIVRIEPNGDPLRRITDLAHELGHLQTSRPDRRSLPEFGLGPGYSTQAEIDSDQVRTPKRTQNLEDYATVICAAYWTRFVGVTTLYEARAIRSVHPSKLDWIARGSGEAMACGLMLAEHWGLINPFSDRPLARQRKAHDDPVLPRIRFEPRFSTQPSANLTALD